MGNQSFPTLFKRFLLQYTASYNLALSAMGKIKDSGLTLLTMQSSHEGNDFWGTLQTAIDEAIEGGIPPRINRGARETVVASQNADCNQLGNLQRGGYDQQSPQDDCRCKGDNETPQGS